MTKKIDFGPQTDLKSVPTSTAVAATYENHEHIPNIGIPKVIAGPLDDTITVYYPIYEGMCTPTPLACGECFGELVRVDIKVVTVR